MPKHVWGDAFRFSDGQLAAAVAACLETSSADCVAAERPALAGREQWVVRLAAAFGEPSAQDRNGLAGSAVVARFFRPFPVTLI